MKSNVRIVGFVGVACVSVAFAWWKCQPNPPGPGGDAGSEVTPAPSSGKSTATLINETADAVAVSFAFGADSVVLPADWPFCNVDAGLVCATSLAGHAATLDLPTSGRYLNVTIAFGGPVGCGSTKAEININNPKWYDVADVSLVDGYSNRVVINAGFEDGGAKLGPPNGPDGNETVFGLFPLGCDICTARQNPPCGILPGGKGCKAGTQYKPDVPCQWQGPVMGGGSHLAISYLGTGIPAAK